MSYYKMYTRMRWWPEHIAHKTRSMIEPSLIHELVTKTQYTIYPPEDRGISQPHFPIKTALNYSQQLKELLKRRPELRETLGKPDGRIHQFLMRQQYWVNKGYTPSVAFEKTETELAENLQEVKSHSAMQLAIQSSGNIRSFYDHYEATAEFEGRNKVKMLEKNLPRYLRARAGENIFKDIDYVNDWENFLVFYSHNYGKDRKYTDFMERAQRLAKIQNEKINRFDGLSGISDSALKAKGAYEKMKNENVQLVEDMKKLGVRLVDGEINVEEVKSEGLKKAVKGNKMIKLMFEKWDNDVVELAEENETIGPEPEDGVLERPHVAYDSDNPYKQIYGRLPVSQYETHDARVERLKRIWNSNKGKEREPEEQVRLHNQAIEALRKVRTKVDQVLVSKGKDPVFPPNSEIPKNDFLITHKFDLEKLGRFLSVDVNKVAETLREKVELLEIPNMADDRMIYDELEPVGPFDGNRSDLRVLKDVDDEIDLGLNREKSEAEDDSDFELSAGERTEVEGEREGEGRLETVLTRKDRAIRDVDLADIDSDAEEFGVEVPGNEGAAFDDDFDFDFDDGESKKRFYKSLEEPKKPKE